MVNWTFPNAQYRPPAQVDTRGLDRLANVFRDQQQQRREAEASAQAAKYRQQRDMVGDQRADRSFGLQERQHADNQTHRNSQLASADKRFGAQQSYQNRQLSLQEQQLKQASEINAGRSTQWGKTGPVFEMNGRAYTVQFADDGSRKVLPLDPGMVPASLSPTLAANKQEALGDAKSRADASEKLPTMELKAKQLIGYMDGVVNHPGYGVGTGTVGSRLPSYSETAQDFDERVQQIQGQTFMLAFQDLRGAGPITDTEGEKATAAYGRVANLKVGSENYKRAVADLKKEVLALVDVVRQKASGGAPQPNAAPVADSAGWSIRLKGQ